MQLYIGDRERIGDSEHNLSGVSDRLTNETATRCEDMSRQKVSN